MDGRLDVIPGGFDYETAREVIGDDVARSVEKKARQDADVSHFDPPLTTNRTYWDSVRSEMFFVVYKEQYERRAARMARMGGK